MPVLRRPTAHPRVHEQFAISQHKVWDHQKRGSRRFTNFVLQSSEGVLTLQGGFLSLPRILCLLPEPRSSSSGDADPTFFTLPSKRSESCIMLTFTQCLNFCSYFSQLTPTTSSELKWENGVDRIYRLGPALTDGTRKRVPSLQRDYLSPTIPLQLCTETVQLPGVW